MMMRSILGLFTRSPFHALQNLGQKVKVCTDEVPKLYEAFLQGDYEAVHTISERISHLEHEADVVKIQARDNLPRTIFMPVDRRDFIEVLSSLDSVANAAQDVGILFTLREMEPHDELVEQMGDFLESVMRCVGLMCELIEQVGALLDVGFEGDGIEGARALIEQIGKAEHRADELEDALSRQLFSIEDQIKPGSLFIWNKILNKIGDIADHAERTGNRMRLFLSY